MEATDSHQKNAAATSHGPREVGNAATQTSAPTMKAVRFHGKEDLRFESIPEPKCGAGQVKVKPAWCGICGSDLHEYMGGPSLCPTTPHPITGEQVPLTFGHEFSGVIEEIGEGVSDKFAVGDRVCIQPIIYDGECGACKDGYINCCYKNGFVGLSGKHASRSAVVGPSFLTRDRLGWRTLRAHRSPGVCDLQAARQCRIGCRRAC